MFTTDLTESQSRIVDLPSMDSTTIVCIINHLYNFRTILSATNVRSLLHTCHMLEVDDLTLDCERYMMDDIDETNCIDYYQDAALFHLAKLERKARRYILFKYEQVCATERFLQLQLEQLSDIISSDHLTVDGEVIVFNSVIRWIHENDTKSDPSILFEHVRFEQMSSDFLTSILKHELINDTEAETYVQSALDYHSSTQTISTYPSARIGLLNEKFITLTKAKHIMCITPGSVNPARDTQRAIVSVGDMTSTFCVMSTGIIVTGGMEANRCISYDVKRDEAKVFTQLLSERWGHAAVVDKDQLYVCGGYDGRRNLSTLHR